MCSKSNTGARTRTPTQARDAKAWEFLPWLGEHDGWGAPQLLAISRVFSGLRGLARSLQGGPQAAGQAVGSGRYKMTNTSFSQVLTLTFAALMTSTLFISAAIGPVAQFI